MKRSYFFAHITKEPPADETSVNAQLLVRGAFVDKLMAGVYSYLPLGLRVLRKIENIVREEMDAIGGQEVLMAMLHPKTIWEQTGGWGSIDVLFKIQSRTEKEYALGQSEEEVVTPLVLSRMHTYKDFPLAVYQIHWKFRDELRAKSGLLRGREFLMKDMYSFHRDQVDFERFYTIAKQAYFRVYSRLGLTAKATEASGGSFSTKISYEFMVLTDAGEDDILYCDTCEFCVNKEIAKEKEGEKCTRCGKGALHMARASEVGNVFDLGQKYGKDFNLGYTDEKGEKQYPIMGCYGIGISRLLGVVVEKFNDARGIRWPAAIAPFQVNLIVLLSKDSNESARISVAAETLYHSLRSAGIDVLFDDREHISAGEKFAEADLIGAPWRVVVSAKTLAGEFAELKARDSENAELISLSKILNTLAEAIKKSTV
ncbi:MAG: aminoacyl--tRNA ligase-related protein [Patescibacteria group bacterium]